MSPVNIYLRNDIGERELKMHELFGLAYRPIYYKAGCRPTVDLNLVKLVGGIHNSDYRRCI